MQVSSLSSSTTKRNLPPRTCQLLPDQARSKAPISRKALFLATEEAVRSLLQEKMPAEVHLLGDIQSAGVTWLSQRWSMACVVSFSGIRAAQATALANVICNGGAVPCLPACNGCRC
ncbi:hypothetical protein WJX75_007288 [Coccomyxa subellipsoidea]|uniref:Uncharacterized protein n=1 Tax=Coccomyxa subellipsoidea TaxID=248742 RepID=A0ABR2Z4B3_9CHLO